jgi:beta-glucosidase/6-phospho-beta-glucosidase/beta-galactosidase
VATSACQIEVAWNEDRKGLIIRDTYCHSLGTSLLAHMHIDDPEIPDGVAILGTDDAAPNAG